MFRRNWTILARVSAPVWSYNAKDYLPVEGDVGSALARTENLAMMAADRGIYPPLVPREVSPLGYQGDFCDMGILTSGQLCPVGKQALLHGKRGENVLLTGASGVGKFSLANHIVDLRSKESNAQKKPLKIARISMDSQQVVRMGGILAHSFFGLRYRIGEDLPSTDQMIASFERHNRLMRDSYSNLFPSMETVDVLLFDSLHLCDSSMLESFDQVAREVRKKNAPFGGVQIIATANFWKMPVDPQSPNYGYLFQNPKFGKEWFRKSNHFYLRRNHNHFKDLQKKFGGEPIPAAEVAKVNRFTELTELALMGSLKKNDINELVAMCKLTKIRDVEPSPLVDNRTGIIVSQPRFARQPMKSTAPAHGAALRATIFGTYLVAALHTGSTALVYGCPDKLDLQVGSRAEVMVGSPGIPRGSIGTVVGLEDKGISISLPELTGSKTHLITPMKVSTSHPDYAEIEIAIQFYPLRSRSFLHPNAIISNNASSVRYFRLDARMLTDTNDLGNVLAMTEGPGSFEIIPDTLEEYTRREGTIHDPTKIYYETLAGAMDKYSERWCRNCKTFQSGPHFPEHWKTCVEDYRWCDTCNVTVESRRFEPHMEKHTVVMCIDCGTSLEWRDWERHRVNCGPMLKELTAENFLLPSQTRENVLISGHDKKDLNDIKNLKRASLPKTASVVHDRRQLYRNSAGKAH